jgi:hypothetical protein
MNLDFKPFLEVKINPGIKHLAEKNAFSTSKICQLKNPILKMLVPILKIHDPVLDQGDP